jgi:hypothetical protein
VVALLGLLLAYLSFREDRKANVFTERQAATTTSPPKSPLQVAAFKVVSSVEVDAIVSYAGEPDRKDKTYGSLIDVTVKNVGDDSLVLTTAMFEVVRAEPLKECEEGGGPLVITGLYDVPLPKPIPRLPFVARKQLTFEVKPHAADRLAFKIGPRKFVDGDWPVLYHIQVSLQHDGAAQSMRGGKRDPCGLTGRGAGVVLQQLRRRRDQERQLCVVEREAGPGVREAARCQARRLRATT